MTDSKPDANGWRTMDDEAMDGRVIQRWHAIYKAPISVRYNEKGFPFRGERLCWLHATYTHAWPERAFTPHYRPLPNPPEQQPFRQRERD